ncbi:MAG: hypothetical protein PHW04_15215 [Candidatus Wallbacteria bacterium]|nr:hypothetical protein [Candidatus Wallbacteria bacterium]
MKKNFQTASRTEFIKQLMDRTAGSCCICVSGLAGSGKTWVAKALEAEILKNRKNAVKLDCRQTSASDFYRSLSEALLPYTGKGQAQTFSEPGKLLDFLAQKSVTLIIDDFQFTESQALALFEKAAGYGTGGLVVFSRERPRTSLETKGEIFTCVLPGLSEQETGVMIDSLFEFQGLEAPAPDAKQTVFRLTQGHPFSIKAICAKLMQGGLTLIDLKNGENLQTVLGNLLEWPAWDSLAEGFRRILKLICVLRIPADREIIRDVAKDDTAAVLEKLRVFCLAEFDLHGRIFLLQILKNFIRGKIKESELSEFHKEAADLLRSRFGLEPVYLEEIYYHYTSAGERHTAIDALADFGTANLFLQEAFQGLIEIIRSEIANCNYRVQDLKAVLIDQLVLQRRFPEALVEIAGLSGFYGQYFSAGVEYYKDNSESAISLYNKILSQTRDQKQRFLLLNKIALCHLDSGESEKTRKILDELPLMQEFTDNPMARIRYHVSYARLSGYSGNFGLAFEKLEQAIGLMQKNRITSGLGNLLSSKGHYLMMLGRIAESTLMAKEILKIGEKNGDTALQISAYGRLALLSYLAGDLRNFIDCHLKCIELCKYSDHSLQIAQHQADIGIAYLRLGESVTAEHYLLTALETIDASEDFGWKITANDSYCELLIVMGRFREALEKLRTVEKLFQGKCPALYTTFNFLMGTVLEKLGEADKAGDYFSLYRVDLDSINSEARKLIEKDNSWLDQKLKEPKKIRILRRDNPTEYISADEAESIRSQAGTFEFFADFTSPSVYVDGNQIEIFRKRVLAKLLQELVSVPGTELSADYLYLNLWNRNFEPETDASTFRSTVSRLRKILDPDDAFRFILNTEDSCGCCFSASVNYCVLLN